VGLLDRIKPPPLLRSGPLLLLPSGTSPDVVDALVAPWAPLRTSKGDDWKLADGLRWIGPIDVTMADASEFDLPGGYPIAYVAQAKRYRGDGLGDRLMDKVIARSAAKREALLDDYVMAAEGISREELDAREREYEAALARDYPQGRPFGAELDAWHLVCGLARRLGGLCRLADGRFFLPEAPTPDMGVTLYARTLLDRDEVADLVRPVLGDLVLVEDDEVGEALGLGDDDPAEWTIARGDERDEISVTAAVWERDLELRMPGVEPLAAFDRTGGRTVEYDLIGPEGSNADLLRACALLAAETDGLVLDDEGFAVDLPPV
jgi:GNAT superfamily N-acetyltransferase